MTALVGSLGDQLAADGLAVPTTPAMRQRLWEYINKPGLAAGWRQKRLEALQSLTAQFVGKRVHRIDNHARTGMAEVVVPNNPTHKQAQNSPFELYVRWEKDKPSYVLVSQIELVPDAT